MVPAFAPTPLSWSAPPSPQIHPQSLPSMPVYSTLKASSVRMMLSQRARRAKRRCSNLLRGWTGYNGMFMDDPGAIKRVQDMNRKYELSGDGGEFATGGAKRMKSDSRAGSRRWCRGKKFDPMQSFGPFSGGNDDPIVPEKENFNITDRLHELQRCLVYESYGFQSYIVKVISYFFSACRMHSHGS
jgi:hypothetical protein